MNNIEFFINIVEDCYKEVETQLEWFICKLHQNKYDHLSLYLKIWDWEDSYLWLFWQVCFNNWHRTSNPNKSTNKSMPIEKIMPWLTKLCNLKVTKLGDYSKYWDLVAQNYIGIAIISLSFGKPTIEKAMEKPCPRLLQTWNSGGEVWCLYKDSSITLFLERNVHFFPLHVTPLNYESMIVSVIVD